MSDGVPIDGVLSDGVLSDGVRALIDDADVGTLAVVRRDGSPHLSTVYHVRDGDRILVSTESRRLKAKAVARDGRATYCVRGAARPYPSVTLECRAVVRREGIGDITALLFTKIFGRETEPMSDDELAAIDRVVLELTVERVYAVTYV